MTSFQFMSLASVVGLVVAVGVEACRRPSRAPSPPSSSSTSMAPPGEACTQIRPCFSATGIGTRLRSSQVSPGKPSAGELHQPPLEIVGEGVIGAHEHALAGARAVGDLGAAMPADVEEGAAARRRRPRTTRTGTPLRDRRRASRRAWPARSSARRTADGRGTAARARARPAWGRCRLRSD